MMMMKPTDGLWSQTNHLINLI